MNTSELLAALGKPPGSISPELRLAFFKGTMQELREHPKVIHDDLMIAGQIALDHLEENPHYYDKERMSK